MSLINDALKKAGQEAGGDDALDNAYPQKIVFLSGRQGRNRWVMPVAVMLVLAGSAAVLWHMPSVTQRLLRLGGGPPAPVPKPRLPAGAPAAGQPVKPALSAEASRAQAERRAQVDQLIKTGTAAVQAGNVAAARAAFGKAAQADSSSAAAHHGLGLAEKLAGNQADAERHYLEAIKLNAGYAEAHNNLALLYDQQGKSDRAIVEYTTALSIQPDYPEARLNYAIALERLGRTADAKIQYGKFLAAVPPELRDVAEKVQARLSNLS
ncbi:MAG: tetratricopeptide repeat protein [Nitrospirae bacterium]|nr:tetratricopeptide repeat protein [Nitrospirota bacterium]